MLAKIRTRGARGPSPGKAAFTAVGLAGLLLVLAFLALSAGSSDLGMRQVVEIAAASIPGVGTFLAPRVDPLDRQILLFLRMPRIILSIMVGGALAIAGAVFQGLFRNPMADPYVLGTSSGAALGATLAYAARLDYSLFGLNAVSLAAFVGAFLTTLLVYNLARTGRRVPPTVLLLGGMAVSLLLASVISLIMIFQRQEMYRIVLWLMGGFSTCRWIHVGAVFPYVVLGLGLTSVFARDLNALLLGEEKAQQLGVDSQRLQLVLALAASMLVTAAVSISGIIGFVGLVVPHAVRLMCGPDHRGLIPLSALCGGIFLLVADTAARTVLAPVELPVGIVTSLLGVPLFVYLLKRATRAKAMWRES